MVLQDTGSMFGSERFRDVLSLLRRKFQSDQIQVRVFVIEVFTHLAVLARCLQSLHKQPSCHRTGKRLGITCR